MKKTIRTIPFENKRDWVPQDQEERGENLLARTEDTDMGEQKRVKKKAPQSEASSIRILRQFYH